MAENSRKGNFPSSARVRKSSTFAAIQTEGFRCYVRGLIFFISRTKNTRSRLGLTVSKRVDPRAVKRNLIKRRLREIFRKYQSDFLQPIDLVIIAKSTVLESSFKQIEQQFVSTFIKHGLLSDRLQLSDKN